MTIKKNGSNLAKKNIEIKTVEPKSPEMLEEKLIAVMLTNYGTKWISASNLSDEEKKQKEHDIQQAAKMLADSLGAKGLLQNILVTELLGVHELQQKLLSYANKSMNHPEQGQYYINAITKLSNVFIQQASLLHKLQGNNQQKVVVEHLHINEGGQAIVGQVNTHSKGLTNEK